MNISSKLSSPEHSQGSSSFVDFDVKELELVKVTNSGEIEELLLVEVICD